MQTQSQTLSIGDLELECGTVLPDTTVAFVTYGRLAANGRNAVLLTHGYTSSHLFAEDGDQSASEGSWAPLVGPGKVIDTEKFFVVAPNVLGSSYGSTSPASINPSTGRRYGPDFPAVTLVDMIRAQRMLLDHLQVKRLVAVIGPSYGGIQAFQWALTFPDFMDCVVPVVAGPTVPGTASSAPLIEELSQDPNWNGGHHYDRGGMFSTLVKLRVRTLKQYGMAKYLSVNTSQQDVDRQIQRHAEAWARRFDANSLIVLREARRNYDVTRHYSDIKARVMLVLSRSDTVFPTSLAPDALAGMCAAGVDARYVEIDSDFGHMAAGLDAGKWAPALKSFIDDTLAKRRQLG